MEEWGVFSTGDASRAVGMSRRQVLLLVEQGLIVPSHESSGRGKARRFSYFDLIRCAIARDLGQHLGIAPRFVKRIVSQLPDSRLRSQPNQVPSPIQITIDGDGEPQVRSLSVEEEAMDVLADESLPTTTLILNLGLIQRGVRSRLEEIH